MENQVKAKIRKLGTFFTEGKYGPNIKLGSGNNTDPKYDFKVQIRILDANGDVVFKAENPNIKLKDTKNPKIKQLTVAIPEETKAKNYCVTC